MPKVVVQTIVSATIKEAAAAKTGRQRAETHRSTGNRRAIGTTVAQGSLGRKITSPLIIAITTSARVPSMSSPRGGGSRALAASPIKSGATVIMPSASDANQCCQMVKIGAVEL